MPIDPTADNSIISSEVLPGGEDMVAFAAEVKATAYRLWEQAGRPSGREDDFWYKALDWHIRARANAEKKLDPAPPQQ